MPNHVELVLRAPQPKPTTWLGKLRESLRSIQLGPWGAKDKTLARYFGAGAKSAAGIVVNEETAFTYSAVFDAVNQIAGDVAKLPLNLHKRRSDGGSDHYVDSKLYRLLKYEPNPEMGSMVFRRTLQAHALTCKGGFAEIERDALNKPVALWPITPDRVEPFRDTLRDGRLGPIQYRIDGTTVIPDRDMIHIHGLGYDGHVAYAVIDKARQAIGLALAAERFGSTFFGNGTSFGNVFMTDAEMDEESVKDFLKVIRDAHGGADRAHKDLVLHGGTWKMERAAIEPEKAQMDALRNRQIEEVARFFNMPLHKLKNLDRATNNNIEQQDLEYYKGCLLTWITLWEEELNRKLIAPLEARQQYIKHNANAFLRGDIKSRYEALGIARDKGIINADEWRELEEMNPQPDGQGKVYLVQAAQIPVGKLSELVDAQIAETKQKAKPKAPSASDEQVAAANARAERAEQLAADAQQRAQEAREALATAEATGKATAEQLAALRADYDKATDIAANLTVLSTELRERVDLVQTAKDVSDEQLRKTAEAKAIAEAKREGAEEAAKLAQLAQMQAEQEEQHARAEEIRAKAYAAEMAREAETARAEAEAAGADKAVALAKQAEAEELAQLAKDLAEDAKQRSHEAHESARAASAALEAAKADTDHAVAELTAQYAQARADSDARARELAEAVKANAIIIAREEETARALLAAKEAAETALEQQREAESARLAGVISAHRALIVDAMGRMIRRETDRVRKAQGSPEKLRAWMDSFYPLHEDICHAALLPAIRTQLAWQQSPDDPSSVTRAIVQAHCAESQRQLRLVLEGEAEHLALNLETVIRQWETERADALADRLLRDEVMYVRQQ